MFIPNFLAFLMQILLAALVIMLEDASVVLLAGTDGQESLKHIYGITANLLKGAHTKENKVHALTSESTSVKLGLIYNNSVDKVVGTIRSSLVEIVVSQIICRNIVKFLV